MKRFLSQKGNLIIALAILTLVILLNTTTSYAQEKQIPQTKDPGHILLSSDQKSVTGKSGKWQWEFTLGAFLPVMDTTITVGDKSTQRVVKPSEVLDKIESAFTGRLEARKDRWGIFTGLYYIKLKDDISFQSISGDTKLDLTIWQTAATYRVSEGNTDVDVLAGFRYQAIDVDVDLSPLAKVSKRVDWMDPIVGARARFPLLNNLDFNLYGDVGGFGVGSKFTWRTDAIFNWHLSEGFALKGGYSILDVDYQKGSGIDEFRYDSTMKGPILGASFKF
ncbi:MAG: hypothetical protein K8T10_16100 [Candidatus Eremiobacteraeota bacterium]|nr:hypothetical protein [Candidatus Eremiobacteraeota bacterium]